MKEKISEKEINEFFTELIGECWHDFFKFGHGYHFKCSKCGDIVNRLIVEEKYNNFFTWEGFGKLWNWAITQKDFLRWWKAELVRNRYGHSLVNPENFARKLYLSLINKGGVKN